MKDVLLVLCTPDHRRETARRCLETVRSTDLSRAELLIVDNAWDAGFQHPATMERFRVLGGNRPIIYLDDDVEIDTSDWIERLLATHRSSGANVVGCRHRSREGTPNHVGAQVFRDGTTEILCERPAEAGPGPFVPAVSSAVMLIADPTRVRFDLRFAKYQHDLDVGLQTWEQGGRVACCPELSVVHVMGDYATTRPEVIGRFWPDATRFREKWQTFASESLYVIPELAGFAATARQSNWLMVYREASARQPHEPDLAAEVFRRIARECPTPERVSGAWFHLYQIEGERSHLEACLEAEPGHRKARALLEQHPQENPPCATSGPSSSLSASPRPKTSALPARSGWARSPST